MFRRKGAISSSPQPVEARPSIRQKRILWALMGQVLFIMLGIGLVGPVMPLYAQSFGVGAAMVGSLITAFGVARIVMNIPAGSLSERVGRRPLLICGPLLTCLAAFLTATAGRFEQLVVFRFIQGLGSSAQTTAAMTVLADITDKNTRGRAMSWYQGALLLGQSLGPTVGGLVAEHFGYRAPFFVYSALALSAAIWAFTIVPETRGLATKTPAEEQEPPASTPANGKRGALATLLQDLNFLLVSLVTLTIFFTRTGSRSTVLPLFGHDRLGLSAGQLGFTFTCIALFNLATINWSGALSDKHGRKAVIVPATIFSGLALVAFTFSRNYAFFLFSGALLGIGTGLAGPAPAAYVADLAQPGSYGITMGLYRTFSDVGVSVGPILLGWISDQAGFSTALWCNACLFLFSGTIFGLFARETVKRGAAPPRRSRSRFQGAG